MTRTIEAFRKRLNKMNIELRNVYIKFPHHVDREIIEKEFLDRAIHISHDLNWIDDRLTEKLLYARSKKK